MSDGFDRSLSVDEVLALMSAYDAEIIDYFDFWHAFKEALSKVPLLLAVVGDASTLCGFQGVICLELSDASRFWRSMLVEKYLVEYGNGLRIADYASAKALLGMAVSLESEARAACLVHDGCVGAALVLSADGYMRWRRLVALIDESLGVDGFKRLVSQVSRGGGGV